MAENEDVEKRILNEFRFYVNTAREHGLDIYKELAETNPEEAALRFNEAMERMLNSAGGFFKGIQCGGPDYVMGSSMINVVGSIYPDLPRPIKKVAFEKVLNYLDGLNCVNSQNHLERVHEPHLLRDVIVNRPGYSPGFELYADAARDCSSWEDFEKNIMKLMRRDAKEGLWIPSQGLLGFALSLTKFSNPEVLRGYSELFPEVCARVKDFDAGVVALQGAYSQYNLNTDPQSPKAKSFGAGLESKLVEFIPQWQDEIYEKVKEGDWIWSDGEHRTREYNKIYADWKSEKSGNEAVKLI